MEDKTPVSFNTAVKKSFYGNMPIPSKLFSALKEEDVPAKPIPYDNLEDIRPYNYPSFYSEKCAICNSPFSRLAEHVFLEEGKKVMSVIRFFATYYDAKLNYTQVATHMEHHCNMRSIEVEGLRAYEGREEEINIWRFREDELAYTALMVELGDIKAIDCGKNNDLKIKKASMIDKILKSISEIKSRRDSNAMAYVDIFSVLTEIHDSLECDADKRKIREKVKEIRMKLMQKISGETS